MHLRLEMHDVLEGHTFFHAMCSCDKFTSSYDKPSTKAADAYMR